MKAKRRTGLINSSGAKAFLICCILLLGTHSLALAINKKPALLIATGSTSGVYYPLGKGLAGALTAQGFPSDVLTTEGSKENILLLEQGKAQLAFAQSDVVFDDYSGEGEASAKMDNIRAIASLYTEAVHILIRKPLNIMSMDEFRGKRISVGPKGSGSESNALTILEAAGITANEVQLMHLSFNQAMKAIKNRDVDIIFITSGFPSDAVSTIMEKNEASLYELHPEILQRLMDLYPFFVATSIPAGTYKHQNGEITTLGVPALLVARNDMSSQLAYTVTRLLFTKTEDVCSYTRKGINIELDNALRGIAIPVSKGASRFYQERGVYRKQLYRRLLNYALVLVCFLALVLAIINHKKVAFFFKTKEIARVFVASLLIWVLGSIVMYLAEHRINESYANLPLSFWSTLIEWLNFGSKEPFTITGRTTAIIMSVLGVGSIAWFTGEIASIFVHKKMTGGKRKMEKIKDHYVIINWNEEGFKIIEQLHSDALSKSRPIIVVSDSQNSITFPEKYQYEGVYIIHGNPTNEAILRRANINNAHSAIILADASQTDFTDAKSILIILAIRKFCITKSTSQIPIVVEILDPTKVDLASYAGLEGSGNVEIVSARYLTQGLLVQAAVHPGLTEIYSDLLTFSRDNCEIYRKKLPSKFANKSFEEFSSALLDLRRKNVEIIPVGICRDGKVYLNPKTGVIGNLQEGDDFFAICYTEEELEKI